MKKTYELIHQKASQVDWHTRYLDRRPVTIEELEQKIADNPGAIWIDRPEHKEALRFMREEAQPGDMRPIFWDYIVCTGYKEK